MMMAWARHCAGRAVTRQQALVLSRPGRPSVPMEFAGG